MFKYKLCSAWKTESLDNNIPLPNLWQRHSRDRGNFSLPNLLYAGLSYLLFLLFV